MKLISTFLLILGIFTSALGLEADYIDLSDEARVPLLAGWALADTGGDYPFRIMHVEQDAELLVFKSNVSEDQRITDNASLKRSVDKVINDVILTLPQGKLLSNTGVFEENRLIFALDFQSFDTTSQETMTHRLVGVIYQHPDGYQLLFTLWGKGYQTVSADIFDDIRLMQDHFMYFGEASEHIYSANQTNWLWITGALLMVIVVLLIFTRKKRKTDISFSEDSNFWRCECGRQNHYDQDSCRRCGRPQQEKVSP